MSPLQLTCKPRRVPGASGLWGHSMLVYLPSHCLPLHRAVDSYLQRNIICRSLSAAAFSATRISGKGDLFPCGKVHRTDGGTWVWQTNSSRKSHAYGVGSRRAVMIPGSRFTVCEIVPRSIVTRFRCFRESVRGKNERLLFLLMVVACLER